MDLFKPIRGLFRYRCNVRGQQDLTKQIVSGLHFNSMGDWQELSYEEKANWQSKVDYNITPNYEWVLSRFQYILEQCLLDEVDEATMAKIYHNLEHQRGISQTVERGKKLLQAKTPRDSNAEIHLAMET